MTLYASEKGSVQLPQAIHPIGSLSAQKSYLSYQVKLQINQDNREGITNRIKLIHTSWRNEDKCWRKSFPTNVNTLRSVLWCIHVKRAGETVYQNPYFFCSRRLPILRPPNWFWQAHRASGLHQIKKFHKPRDKVLGATFSFCLIGAAAM